MTESAEDAIFPAALCEDFLDSPRKWKVSSLYDFEIDLKVLWLSSKAIPDLHFVRFICKMRLKSPGPCSQETGKLCFCKALANATSRSMRESQVCIIAVSTSCVRLAGAEPAVWYKLACIIAPKCFASVYGPGHDVDECVLGNILAHDRRVMCGDP